MTALYLHVQADYFIPYFIFFSALIVTIRSDLETMLISRYVTLFLIPVGIAFSLMHLLPISPQESVMGALLGYLFLWAIAQLFLRITGKEGMGQGDMELLAFIGSFTGVIGCWISLLLASIIGSLIGFCYIIFCKAGRSVKIPFGPFLALGAMIFVLFQQDIVWLMIR